MQMQYKGMTLTGTPQELATFVKEYESVKWKPTYTYPSYPLPYWYGASTTGGTAKATYSTGYDATWNGTSSTVKVEL